MAVGVGQIADLVDCEDRWLCVVVEAAAQRGVAVQCSKIAKQAARSGEQCGVSCEQRLVGDVLNDHRLADAVRADHDAVAGVLEEVERHQRFDSSTVTHLRPVPVEVAQRLEAADPGLAQAPLQAATGAFLLFPLDQGCEPGRSCHFVPMREQAVQLQRAGTVAETISVTHRPVP